MTQILEYTMLSLVLLSLLLLVLSFFAKDKMKTLEEQIDHLTISFAQETYQIKKKLKVLEEELLVSDDSVSELFNNKPSQNTFDSEVERVFFLYTKGLPYEQIAKETSLTTEEVRMILQQKYLRGMQ